MPRIDDEKRYLEGGRIFAGPIIPSIGPDAIVIRKYIYKLTDLSAAGEGTRINVGASGEVRIMSDVPIEIKIGDAGTHLPRSTRLTFVGQVDYIHARPLQANTPGVLVIMVGAPYLGAGWNRPDPKNLAIMNTDVTTANGWAATPAVSDEFYTMPLPGPYDAEAIYLHYLYLERASGTITGFECEEIDTAVGWLPIVEYQDNADNTFFRKWENPVRISNSFKMTAFGSAEVGATDIRYVVGFTIV